MITKIISGAQTGVDQIALDAAIFLEMDYSGFIPKGRRCEDGTIPDKYIGLIETTSSGYISRTAKNIEHSDATLIVTPNILVGGSLATSKLCVEQKKPYMVVYYGEGGFSSSPVRVANFLEKNRVSTLNIAGPRASNIEDYERFSKDLIVYISSIVIASRSPHPNSFGL